MANDYWTEQEKCPFFVFTQNPRGHKGTGHRGCTHSDPTIGEEGSSRISTNKRCTHGKLKTASSEYKCEFLTRLMKLKGHPNKDCVYREYVTVKSGAYILCNRPMDEAKRKRNTSPCFGAGDSECTWKKCPHYSKDTKQATLTEFYDHCVINARK